MSMAAFCRPFSGWQSGIRSACSAVKSVSRRFSSGGSASQVVAQLRWWRPIALTIGITVTFGLAGCCLPLASSNGTTKHLIIGVGIVAINDGKPAAATATNVKSLGLSLTNQPGLKANIGYASSKAVTIAELASVTVEVVHSPTEDILVEVHDYKEDLQCNSE